MATLSNTLSGTGPTQVITIQTSDWNGTSAAGDKYQIFQDAPGGTAGTHHVGVGGIGSWLHGAYSTTTDLSGSYDSASGNGSLFVWDNGLDVTTAASTTFSQISASNTACTGARAAGGAFDTGWIVWANGVHVSTKKYTSATAATGYPSVNYLNAAATTQGAHASLPNFFANGPAIGLAIAAYQTSEGLFTDASTYVSGGVTYRDWYQNAGGGFNNGLTNGLQRNYLLVTSGRDNTLTATVRDAIAADYRTHSGTNLTLTVTTGTKATTVTDLYGTAGVALTDGYDPQYAAWRIAAATNHVTLGGAFATNNTPWGIDGTAVTTRYRPCFVISAWTDTAATPTVKLGATTLVSGTDFVAYTDTTNHILFLALLFDIPNAATVTPPSGTATTMGALDVTAGTGLFITDSSKLAEVAIMGGNPVLSDLLSSVSAETLSWVGTLSGAEALVLGETWSIQSALALLLSDGLKASEALALALAFTPQEILPPADVLSWLSATALTDQGAFAETVSFAQILSVILSDSLTPSDALTSIAGVLPADSALSTDALSVALALAASDNPRLAEALAWAIALTGADSASLSDLATIAAVGATATIALTLLDAFGQPGVDSGQFMPGSGFWPGVVVGTSGMTETLAAGSGPVAGDSLSPADALASIAAAAFADAATPGDALAATLAATFIDVAATSTDVATFAGIVALILGDTLTPGEIAAWALGVTPPADTLSPLEGLVATALAAWGDALAQTDSLSFAAILALAVSDALTVADALATTVAPLLADVATPGDGAGLTLSARLADALATGEGIAFPLIIALALADSLAAGDTTTLTLGAGLTDALATLDAPAFAALLGLLDAVAAGDLSSITSGSTIPTPAPRAAFRVLARALQFKVIAVLGGAQMAVQPTTPVLTGPFLNSGERRLFDLDFSAWLGTESITAATCAVYSYPTSIGSQGATDVDATASVVVAGSVQAVDPTTSPPTPVAWGAATARGVQVKLTNAQVGLSYRVVFTVTPTDGDPMKDQIPDVICLI